MDLRTRESRQLALRGFIDAMQVLMMHDAADFEAIATFAMHLADDCRRKYGLEPTDVK